MPYKDPEKQKAAQARHYKENSGQYKERSKRAREARFAKIAELKDKPCTDCKESYPSYVMHFDHIEDNKINSIANLATRASWQAVLDEIEKCELVCANCHAERTHQRIVEKRCVVQSGRTVVS